MNWEDTFRAWSQGPSETEQQKCENAERAIKAALNDDPELSKLDTYVFTQGSYRAKTNVRNNSDVDIGILLYGNVFADYDKPDITQKDAGLIDSDFTFLKFKDMVGRALVNKFGAPHVTRGNKAFDVHENSYRVDADVVPLFEHHRYYRDSFGKIRYHEGVAFKTDGGKLVKNWPEQTYNNGVAKNTETKRRYKRSIRIIKRLRDAMQNESIKESNDIASFLIESLVWNTPSTGFSSEYYTDNIREVLAHAYNNTLAQEHCDEWGEVNELKYLFRDSAQPWTRQQAHDFISAAWDYVGYK